MPIDLNTAGCFLTKLDLVGEQPIGISLVAGKVLTIDCLPIIIQNLVFWLLVFGGTIALIIVIIAGIKLITSGGDAKQVEGARKTMTFAIIGLVLILLSFAIMRFISQATGVGCITKFGFACQSAYTPADGTEVPRDEINCDPKKYKPLCYNKRDKSEVCRCIGK